jgi:hypothetical protein
MYFVFFIVYYVVMYFVLFVFCVLLWLKVFVVFYFSKVKL